MSGTDNPPRSFRVVCAHFSPEEIEATRRLLGLLGTNLKQRWVLAEAGEPADVVLLNLDQHAPVEFDRRAALAGCSQRPREHPAGTLHRPLRGYELLALLNKEAPAAQPSHTPAVAEAAGRYRLRCWPYEANSWDVVQWRIMAAMRRTYRSAQELAEHSGATPDQVQRCIDAVNRLGALERAVDRQPAAAAATRPAGLRRLAVRVGAILGFSR
jgi:hypothetical protein